MVFALIRKEVNMFGGCAGTRCSLQDEERNRTKLSLYPVRLCPLICQTRRMSMFFAVTLLFILPTLLFTWDSFLSLCQSPAPPHFCTDNVKQSAEDEGLTL